MFGSNKPSTGALASGSSSKKTKRKARKRQETKRNWRKFRKRARKGFWGAAFKIAKRVGQAAAIFLMWTAILACYWLAMALGVPTEIVTDKVFTLK